MVTDSNKAPINPEILRWARESLAIDMSRAAKTASVDIERYLKWEDGEELPTVPMLRKLANLYKRPLAVFFMPAVPKEPEFPTDFRLSTPRKAFDLSTETRLAIRKAMWNQNSAKDLLDDLGYEYKREIPKVTQNKSIDELVQLYRKIKIKDQFGWSDNWEALRSWREYIENQGLFVFQFGMPINEVRGFTLIKDNHPTVIVINSKDTVNGRIFTLFHEFGHYLLKEAGICNPKYTEIKDTNINSIEKYCNTFSGNFLVPSNDLINSIETTHHSDNYELLYALSKKYKVSNFVILKRLHSLDKIEYDEYRDMFSTLIKRIKHKKATSGGSFYKNKIAEKGKRFIRLVVEAESNRSITTSTALDLLNIKLKSFNTLTQMLYEK